MALEDRVRALEDEIGILKGQVHSTLLEIQEQILMHYYPDLRAKDAAPADGALAFSRGNAGSRSVPPFVGLQRVAIGSAEKALAPDQDEMGPEKPEGAGLPAGAPGASAEDEPPSAEGPMATVGLAEGTDWSTVTRLMEWASVSVEAMGRERVARALTAYAKGGHLSSSACGALLQIVALADEGSRKGRVRVRAVLDRLLKLNEILDCDMDVAAVSRLVEEESVG